MVYLAPIHQGGHVTVLAPVNTIHTYNITDHVAYKHEDQPVVVKHFEVEESPTRPELFIATVTTECEKSLIYWSMDYSRWPSAVQRLFSDHTRQRHKRA